MDPARAGFVHEENATDHWLTPPAMIAACGPFDLDPCAYVAQPWRTAEKQFTLPESNGLLLPWGGVVWCNPPYGPEIPKWIERMALHDNGVLLMFARTDTRAFRRLWDFAAAFLFLHKRVGFYKPDGTPTKGSGAPSVLVAFGKQNISRLERAQTAGYGGALVTHWTPDKPAVDKNEKSA